MKTNSPVLPFLFLIAAASCGRNNSATETAGENYVSDSEQTAAVGLSNLEDSLSMIADQAASSSLALASSKDKDSSRFGTRSCAVDGNKAVVTIKGDVDRSMEITRARITSLHSFKGTESIKRTWSRQVSGKDVAVTCADNALFAKINWNDVAGLKLETEYSRTRERTFTLTNSRKNTTKTRTASYSASGMRTIQWDSSTPSDSGTSFTRSKSVTFSGTKTLSVTDKDGNLKSIALDISSKEGAPLKVNTERKAADYSLMSNTLVSGTIVAYKKDAGIKAETTFENLKISFSDSGTCSLVSGTKKTLFYQDGSSEPVASLTLTASNGELTVLDKSGAEVEDFESPECDASDYKL